MTSIPRFIHQIWLQGDHDIPDQYRVYAEKWRVLNSNFSYIPWCLTRFLNEFPEQAGVVLEFRLKIQIVDYMKYIILAKYGGIYVDMDMEPLQPLDNLFHNIHPLTTLLLCKQPPCKWYELSFYKGLGLKHSCPLNNGMLAAAPDHPGIHHLIRTSRQKNAKHLHDFLRGSNFLYVQKTTGPMVFTNVLKHYIDDMDDKTFVLESHFFEPCVEDSAWGMYRGVGITRETVAVHHHALSWVGFIPHKILHIHKTRYVPWGRKRTDLSQ